MDYKKQNLIPFDFCKRVNEYNQVLQIPVTMDKQPSFISLYNLQLDDEYSGLKIKLCIKLGNDLKVSVWSNDINFYQKDCCNLTFQMNASPSGASWKTYGLE